MAVNEQPRNIAARVQRLIKCFGSQSGIILEFKGIIAFSKWNNVQVVYLVGAYLVGFLSQMWKSKR